MADSRDPAGAEPWQRFTLLDAFLLQFALALGLTWSRTLWGTQREWVLYGGGTAVALGSVLAAPMVLGVHWGLRKRRAPPSMGEQLWIASFVCWLTGYALATLLSFAVNTWAGAYAITSLVLCLCPVALAQTGCSVAALVWLIRRIAGKEAAPPCKWTDAFGSVACLLFGIWAWIGPALRLYGVA
jgi:hypothetical protein